MFFWTLLLSHIVGDFPLQTDAVYRLKTKYRWGVLPHVAICSLMNIAVLIPFLGSAQAWTAILFLGVVHAIFDRTKISVSVIRARDSLFHFLLDQLLHVFSVWLAALWLTAMIPAAANPAAGWSANRELIIQLTALIAATFAGVPIIYYAQKFWCMEVKKVAAEFTYPTLVRRVPGYFERFLATLALIMGGWWMLIAAAAFIPRVVVNWRDEERPQVMVSSVVGFGLCLACGLLVRLAA